MHPLIRKTAAITGVLVTNVFVIRDRQKDAISQADRWKENMFFLYLFGFILSRGLHLAVVRWFVINPGT
jgi:hypothetical protein